MSSSFSPATNGFILIAFCQLCKMPWVQTSFTDLEIVSPEYMLFGKFMVKFSAA
jgi:hypothetical protein